MGAIRWVAGFILSFIFCLCILSVLTHCLWAQTPELLAMFDEEVRKAGLIGYRSVLGGQIEQESAWRPHVVSRAGAKGLCQAIDSTVDWLGPEVDPPCDDALDARCCLQIQSEYMRREFRRYRLRAKTIDDRIAMALSAYNGGAGNTNREIRSCKKARWRCDHRSWYGNVADSRNCKGLRSTANCRENREYMIRIMRKEPKYRRSTDFVYSQTRRVGR